MIGKSYIYNREVIMETKSNDLEYLFLKNKDEIINKLNKGIDIVIRKNKDNYVIYSNLIKKLK